MAKSDPLVVLPEDLLDAVRIEPGAIEEEYTRCPGDLAYWNERHAMATEAFLNAKTERERMHGELLNDPAIFDALAERLDKKPSIDQLKGEIETLEEYCEARAWENKTKADLVRMRGFVDDVLAKKEMLISLGAHIRTELQRDALIREKG